MNLAILLKSKRGVTLIELLVVVVILGIIAAVVVPMVMDNQAEAYANTNQQNLAIVNEAAQRYIIDNGGQVGDLSDSGVLQFNELIGTYIQDEPDVYDTDGNVINNAEWGINNDGVVTLPGGAA